MSELAERLEDKARLYHAKAESERERAPIGQGSAQAALTWATVSIVFWELANLALELEREQEAA